MRSGYAIEFHAAQIPPLQPITAAAPRGAVIGLIGAKGSGTTALLRLAAGIEQPNSGIVSGTDKRRFIGPTDELDLTCADVIAADHALCVWDAFERATLSLELQRFRERGGCLLLTSHEPDLLRGLCDEVWLLDAGALIAQGDPKEMLDRYQARVAERLRSWGETLPQSLSVANRRGDGRAEIVSIEALGASGAATLVWNSGEEVRVRVTLRFRENVKQPVIGLMLRTLIGFAVYGTNTELEHANLGTCSSGDTKTITFAFRCDLCPGEYTITVASHDPDGTPHDWLDDALAIAVVDARYTAGVANLRARVTLG